MDALGARFLYAANTGNALRFSGMVARGPLLNTSVSRVNQMAFGPSGAWETLTSFLPFVNTFGADGSVMRAYTACIER